MLQLVSTPAKEGQTEKHSGHEMKTSQLQKIKKSQWEAIHRRVEEWLAARVLSGEVTAGYGYAIATRFGVLYASPDPQEQEPRRTFWLYTRFADPQAAAEHTRCNSYTGKMLIMLTRDDIDRCGGPEEACDDVIISQLERFILQ